MDGEANLETITATAAVWLIARLTPGPRRIADVISEWCGGHEVRHRDRSIRWEGGQEKTSGRWIKDLNEARQVLGIVAYEEDGKIWWRMPGGRQ